MKRLVLVNKNHKTFQQVSLETSPQFHQTTQCHITQDGITAI